MRQTWCLFIAKLRRSTPFTLVYDVRKNVRLLQMGRTLRDRDGFSETHLRIGSVSCRTEINGGPVYPTS